MLKRCLLGVVLLGLIGAVSATVLAQDSDNQQPQQGEGPGHRHFDPARRVEMLTKQLKLTSDQQGKVLDILKSEQSKMQSLRSDSAVPQEDRRSKMMDIHKDSNDQIRGLLDPDQQKKWDEMQNRRDQWQEHRQGGQAPDSSQQQK